MPIPTENQTQDEFLRICVPQVMEDGTAENPEQAVAICYQIWNDNKEETENE